METSTCACGHSREEHGNDPEYPSNMECDHFIDCGCVAYEAEEPDGSDSDGEVVK